MVKHVIGNDATQVRFPLSAPSEARRQRVVVRKLKIHKIFLSTGKNWESVKFYEYLGYKVAAIFPNHYGVGILCNTASF